MKSLFKIFFTFYFLLSHSVSYAFNVKVLLATLKPGERLKLSSSDGFFLKDPLSKHPLKLENCRKAFDLSCCSDGLYLEGKRLFKENIIFESYGSVTHFNNEKYLGSFLIQKFDNNYLVVNIVPLEDYVFSVLKKESWPGWPLEMNKVMAIIARTYCLYRIMLSYKNKLPYHIRSSSHHQIYQGVHNCAISKKAVEETEGLFLSYKGRPILAMFDSCCGGIVPGHTIGIVDFKKAPYLHRLYACEYCKYSKLFNWSQTYSLDAFINLIQEEIPFIVHDIQDIKIVDTDKAGLVKKVIVKSSKETFSLSGDQMYGLSNKIKSYAFTVAKKGKKIVLKGKGFGHHIGLCQWGAREMVRLEFPYKKILDFYYPDTQLMKFIIDKESHTIKGGVCQDIKGILSEAQLRLLA